MTFDTAVSTDWGSALADLWTAVGGLPNWTQTDSSGMGDGSMGNGDYFVLGTPGGEDIRVAMDPEGNGASEIAVERGLSWVTANTEWGDRFQNDLSNKLEGGSDYVTFAPLDDSSNQPRSADSVTYWLAYNDTEGFGFYVERNEADGSDSALFLGLATLTETWDYDAADSRESNNALGYLGHYNRHYTRKSDKWKRGRIKQTTTWNHLPAGPGGVSKGTVTAIGRPNADANFSNFPMVEENAVASNQFSDTIVGTHTAWLHPVAGADGDTIEDSNGNKLYTILKRDDDGLPMVALRHL